MEAKNLNKGPSATVCTLILTLARWVTQGKLLNYSSLPSLTQASNNTYQKGLLISK